jgi:hypothetical protein
MRTRTFFWLCSVVFLIAACGSSSPGGGGHGGGSGLGLNASVPVTCQMCLTTSTSNECESKGNVCDDDPDCQKLNACVNKCANINAACIASCGDNASQDAIDEWNTWSGCTCGTCASQCGATFCNIGDDSGSNTGGSCIADNDACSSTEPCCTFCASDNYCGCIESGTNAQCSSNSDCCSNACDGGFCD